ncbi:MAG TPA: hypothetical protein VN809_02990, partial [Telmatospirillum sp.]|nr:hypothetical protein [Telmatospirillum sp.]
MPLELYHTPMGYVLSKVIGTLLAPGIVLVIGLTVATALLWTRRFGPRARTLLSALVVGFWALLVLPIQPWMIETLEERFPANPPLPERIDGIIILGGAIDPVISQVRHRITVNAGAERLIAGVRLAKAHPEAKLLYTGGSADPLR